MNVYIYIQSLTIIEIGVNLNCSLQLQGSRVNLHDVRTRPPAVQCLVNLQLVPILDLIFLVVQPQHTSEVYVLLPLFQVDPLIVPLDTFKIERTVVGGPSHHLVLYVVQLIEVLLLIGHYKDLFFVNATVFIDVVFDSKALQLFQDSFLQDSNAPGLIKGNEEGVTYSPGVLVAYQAKRQGHDLVVLH